MIIIEQWTSQRLYSDDQNDIDGAIYFQRERKEKGMM